MKNRFLLPIALFLLFTSISFGQLPSNDPAWVLQTNMSEEFDTSAIRTYRWYTNYWSHCANGAEYDYDTNLICNGTTLKIRADTLKPNYYESDTNKLWGGYNTSNGHAHGLTFAYQGGVVISKNVNYKFGYLEAYAKFPSKKYSLWPAFWLYYEDCTTPGHHYYNEVDIAENAAVASFHGNEVGNVYHIRDDSCRGEGGTYEDDGITAQVPVDSLSGGFHKFAAEWDPHSITYYFDDVPTWSVYSASGKGLPQYGMGIIINFCVDPWHVKLPSDWTHIFNTPLQPTHWPQYFEIDYVRYYKLGVDCSTALNNLCTPAGYDRKVKKSISTDNTCTPTFNQTTPLSSYTLRATDFVLLDVGTTINPTGTGYFAVEIIGCPQ